MISFHIQKKGKTMLSGRELANRGTPVGKEREGGSAIFHDFSRSFFIKFNDLHLGSVGLKISNSENFGTGQRY